jgi:microcystin-dependent protein
MLAAGHDGEPTNPIQTPHIYLPFVAGIPTVNMAAASVQSTGQNSPLPFSIIQPVLAVNAIISLFGVFPSQN